MEWYRVATKAVAVAVDVDVEVVVVSIAIVIAIAIAIANLLSFPLRLFILLFYRENTLQNENQ